MRFVALKIYCTMKTKKEKPFDAVKMMRDIRDKISAETKSISEQIAAMPAARPSILSRRLSAFVTAAIHKIVRGTARSAFTGGPRAIPEKTAIAPATIWAKSLT